MFVDMLGLWWLGDFGSAVIEGTPIVTTTPWFTPSKNLAGQPARFYYDWQVIDLGSKSDLVGTKHMICMASWKRVMYSV